MSALTEVVSRAGARIGDYESRRVRLTESDTIRVLVLPVLEALGWNLQDVEEVRSEYRHTSADNPVDYALFLHGAPALFVEGKALGVSLDDRKPLLQTLNYANAAGVDWCVLTNGAEWRIYKVHAPVAAEEKLFLSARLDEGGEAVDRVVATLSLLSRDRMRARAIDTLWSEWRVDREVERVLDTITGDDAFIRLITRKTDGLSPAEVRASLARSGLRSFYPAVDEVTARLDDPKSPNPAAPADPAPDGPARARPMRTPEMVERGLLPVGTVLTIKDRPESAATVVDGKHVEYRGAVMRFSEWGCRVTGWSAIGIYKWAVLPDGRLLEALRSGSTSHSFEE